MGLAIWVRMRSAFSISLPTRGLPSGRCCRWAPLAMATRRTSVSRRLPATRCSFTCREWLDDYALVHGPQTSARRRFVDRWTPARHHREPAAIAAVPTAAGIEREIARIRAWGSTSSSCSSRALKERVPALAESDSWATCRSTSRTTPPTCGPSRSYFKLDDRGRCSRRPACRPTTSAPPGSSGATPSTTGTRCAPRPASLVDPPHARDVRALRRRAHRPLPRLRGVLGGAG
jgi:hypothetical protein